MQQFIHHQLHNYYEPTRLLLLTLNVWKCMCGLVCARDMDNIENSYEKNRSFWNVDMEKDGEDQQDSKSQ